MLLEMHCHTAEHSSCSHVSANDLIRQIYRRGLQGAVITDHHYVWPEEELEALKIGAEVPDYFLVFSGQEVSTSDMGDLLVYGVKEVISKGTSATYIREKYPHAAMVLAHPYRHGKTPGHDTLLNPLLDGVEIFSSNHSVAENARGLRDWHRYRFTAIAGTDTHGSTYAGVYPTLFDHPLETIADLAEELKRGRCRPFFKEIPKAGTNVRVDEITIGTKGDDETRERIIIREFDAEEKWQSAQRAFHIMEEIAHHGFDRGTYRVPRPIEHDKENMTVIEQGLRGNSLFEKLIRSSMEDAKLFVQLAAQWLARLHNQRLKITPPAEFLEKEQERLVRYVERFEKIQHAHARRARETMEAVRKAEITLYEKHPEQLVQGHGDYHLKNIYVGQDNLNKRETLYIAAIDFSSSLCLPPAFDVGTFLAQFRNQLLDYPEILREIPENIFLDEYISSAKEINKDFQSEVELFRARADLSIASFLIKVGLGESENLWRVLVEAETAMAQFEAARQLENR
ncbi:MAG TPA: phosphotransferase [Syntrophorhabdales bacterium]|nr:phosphotransferase [Syntrophorhabdales bacterium]